MASSRYLVVLALVAVAASVIPTGTARLPEGDRSEIMLDASTDISATVSSLEPASESFVLDHEAILPDVPAPSLDREVLDTRDSASDAPVQASASANGSSEVVTPLATRTSESPLPTFLFNEEGVNSSFAFTEGTVDINEDARRGLVQGSEQIGESSPALVDAKTEGLRAHAQAWGEGLIDSAPRVGYHADTRHVAARMNSESVDLRFPDAGNPLKRVRQTHEGVLHRPGAGVPIAPVAMAAEPSGSVPNEAAEKTGTSAVSGLQALALAVRAHDLAATTVAAIMGAAAAVAVVLIGLYSLFQSKDVLKSEIRRKIYNTISENPGITIVHLAELIGVRHQTVCYHLQLLKKGGYVTAHQKGNKVLHFVNGAGLNDAHRELLVVEQGSVTMRVLQEIMRTPAIIKKDVAAATGLTRTGGAWHVNKLVKLGLVREEKKHGHCRLYPVEERVSLLFELRAEADAIEPAPTQIPVQGGQDAPGFIHPT